MTTAAGEPTHRQVIWPVLAATSLMGFLVGVFVRPAWTQNLIGAQILAGVVPYSGDSLMPAVYVTPYSVLTQSAALLLRLDMPEWSVALLFSGLQAALGCAALAALTLAFSRSVLTSLFVPVLLLRLGEALPMWPSHYLAVFHGHVYPNTFPVGPGVFGPTGMFLGLLSLALLGLDRPRAAALLLALLPAVHVGLVPPFFLAAGVVAYLARHNLRGQWKGVANYFGAGMAVCAVTVLWHVTHLPPSPPGADSVRGAAIADAFVRLWDDHTRLLAPGEWPGLLESEIYTFVLGLSCLTYLRRHVTEALLRIAQAVLIVSAAAIGYTVVLHAAPEWVPWQVRAALITRWLNISSWFFPVAGLGLLGSLAFERGNATATLVLATISVLVWGGATTTISFSGTGAFLDMVAAERRPPRYLWLVFPLLVTFAACWLTSRDRTGPADVRFRRRLRIGVAPVVAVLWVLPFRNAAWTAPAGSGACAVTIAQARQGEGVLLLGANLWAAEWVQVRTRRPLLFEPMDVNILPFSPQAGPRAAEILKKVYGVDVAAGPSGQLDDRFPGYSFAQWQRIAGEFQVSEVLVRNHVVLALPVVATDDTCTLYRIPPAGDGVTREPLP